MERRETHTTQHAPVKDVLTCSAIANFQTCRRKYKYRDRDGLVPISKPRYLRFGAAVHACLGAWYRTHSVEQMLAAVDSAFPNREGDANDKADWHSLSAMMRAYATRFDYDDVEMLSGEQRFDSALVNPASGRSSRSFRVAGGIAGVVRQGDDVLLFKHKTVAAIPHDLGDRLAADLSLHAHAYFAREALGHPITGTLCNVLVKPRLVQAVGESEESYQARCAELIAASKTGKTSAKRRLPESDEEFQGRLAAWLAAEPRFVRFRVPLDADTVAAVRTQMWGVGKEILLARRENHWHRNSHACFGFGACAYWPVCSATDPAAVIASQFRVERADEGTAADDAANDDPTASF